MLVFLLFVSVTSAIQFNLEEPVGENEESYLISPFNNKEPDPKSIS